MNSTALFLESFGASKVAPAKFKVVILCEGAESGRQAREFSERLFRGVANPGGEEVSLWRFGVLSISEARYAAAEAARDADVVVVSASGEHELPPQVGRWLELWTWLLDGTKARLVTLVNDSTASCAGNVCSALRRFAEQKGLEFFAESGLAPGWAHSECESFAAVDRWYDADANAAGVPR